jgi:hypothetical protein
MPLDVLERTRVTIEKVKSLISAARARLALSVTEHESEAVASSGAAQGIF